MLGNSMPFSAKVANAADTAVSWSVNGIPGGNATSGTITPDGVYNAPTILPASATVQITAASHADATKSDTAAAAIVRDIAISVAPNPANVELGATQTFHSSVASSGHPDSATRWSLSGVACPNGCGSVDASGTYTAPQILPLPASVTLTAQSVADPSKQVSAALTITSNFSLQLSAPPSVPVGATTAIVATLTAIPASNPSTAVAWTLSGTGCSGVSCGTISGTTTQTPATLVPLARTATQNACGSDGVNSICFDQADMAFTPGVVAFTRVIATDRIGMQVGSSAVATQLGQILDADIYFNPSGSPTTYATPQALASNRTAYDLESVLTHELGHTLGFSHSAVWSAIMFPFAAAPGTFSGMRPTVQQPDAPLGEDDRAGLRVLYANPADALHAGSIRGQIFPASPLALPASPPGVTGVFGAQVVAVDVASGAVAGSTMGGWSCSGTGPVQFDGSYEIDGLTVGHSYVIYAEALNGAVDPSSISNAIVTLCRNAMTDPGWPPLQGCVVPAVNTSFTTRTRPGP